MKIFLVRFIRNKVLLVISIIVLAGVVYYAYGAFFGQSTPMTQYVTAKAMRGTLVVTVTGSGQVAASSQINIESRVSGTVVAIPVKNNDRVSAGDVLIKLDTTNDERAVRNAETSFENAQLALQTLLEPPATSTLLQSQGSAVQAEQSFTTDQNNLTTDYNNTFTEVSNTYIDIPAAMTGLNNILYSTSINKAQSNIDAYTNMISIYSPNVYQYNQSAAASYQAALSAYNQSLADYKNASVYSSTSTIEALLAETYNALRAISAANGDTKNLLDLVSNVLQQNTQKIPAQLTTDEVNMQSYITTTNNHLTAIIQKKNLLQSDKQAIAAAIISVSQTAAALAQLQSGPTDLQIQTQKLAVTQAQNALDDAKQNLAYDDVRAPFFGIVTNITAKVSQPVSASAALAILVGPSQLAQGTLNEVDVVNVKVGQKANIAFDALPNLALTGTVSQVDTIGAVAQGVVSYNVQVALDVPNDAVRPGMSDTISIITNVKQGALLVQNFAITTRQGLSTVERMGSDGAPVPVQVATGIANDTMTEILSGLNEGDAVVTKTINKTTQATPTQQSGFRLPGIGGGAGGGGGVLRGLGR